MKRLRILPILFLSAASLAQTAPARHPAPSAAESPVGHWIAEHTSKQELGLWWDFRPDGTVTATVGGIVNGTYTLHGKELSVASQDAVQSNALFDVRFADGKLYSTAHGDHPPTMEFSRVSPPTDPASPIVGTWKMTGAPHTGDPEQEAVRERMMKMIVAYGADGTYRVRMPAQSIQGNWDPESHTYRMKDGVPLHYERTGEGLKLALPPDGKESHLYLRDTLLEAAKP